MGRLHFFPGPHVLVWEVDGKAAERVEAWGGIKPPKGYKDDIMDPQPTTPGRYIIHSCGPYRTRTWKASRIAWGTPLRVDRDSYGNLEVLYQDGSTSHRWKPVKKIVDWATYDQVKVEFGNLFGDKSRYDSDHDGVPDVWVFNDFGPLAIRYFADKNRNRKLDGGEHLSGEMFHTTPDNEGEVEKGLPVVLAPSHGCIHLSPISRDRLLSMKAFEPGTDLIIHRYEEILPAKFK